MSGGSMQYLCWKLDDYKDDLKDKMLVAMATDFVKVLHDAEWYLSGDICEGTYNETVKEFKNKWMNPKTIEKRYKEVIEDSVQQLKTQLFAAIGIATSCQDCKYFLKDKDLKYGRCEANIDEGYLHHQSEYSCDKFEQADKEGC